MLGAQFANQIDAHKWCAMNLDLLSPRLFTSKWDVIIPVQRKKFCCISEKRVSCYRFSAGRMYDRI